MKKPIPNTGKKLLQTFVTTFSEKFEAGWSKHGGFEGIFQTPVTVEPQSEFFCKGDSDILDTGIRGPRKLIGWMTQTIYVAL